MPTFEEFAQQFDINNPEQYREMLHKYQRFIDALWDVYDSRWTLCGGCGKTVRFDLAAKSDEVAGATVKHVTRCPECDAVWFVRNVEDV